MSETNPLAEAVAGAQAFTEAFDSVNQFSDIDAGVSDTCLACVQKNLSGGNFDKVTAIQELDLLRDAVIDPKTKDMLSTLISRVDNLQDPLADPSSFLQPSLEHLS